MNENLVAAMRYAVKEPENSIYYTPVFRVAFTHLDVAWSGTDPNAKPAFSVISVFADDAELSYLSEDLDTALTSRFGPTAKRLIQTGAYKYPLRPKLVMAKYAGFEGDGYFASLRAQEEAPPACIAFLDDKPTLLQQGAIERHIYAGSYAYAAVSIYTYDRGGGKGVALGLRTLVKVADGERFTGPAATTIEEARSALVGVTLPPGLLPSTSGGLLLEAKAEKTFPKRPHPSMPTELMDVLS